MANKFVNVDIVTSLGTIMRGNTAYYQTDFDTDAEIMWDCLIKDESEPAPLLWLSRPSGTHLFPERQVFLKDTRAHNTWIFYGEQTRDPIRAYAVELTGSVGVKLVGNLYELDYDAHWRHVREAALPTAYVQIGFTDGHNQEFTFKQYSERWNEIYSNYGKVSTIDFSSHSESDLLSLLEKEHRERQALPTGVLNDHLRDLSDRKVLLEAQRIQRELKALQCANSLNKTHYMVELSSAFLLTASNQERDKVLQLLQYKTLSFASLDEHSGLFAFISKDEPRDQLLHLPKPTARPILESSRMVVALPAGKRDVLER